MNTEKLSNLRVKKIILNGVEKLKKHSTLCVFIVLSIIGFSTYNFLHKYNIYQNLYIAFTNNKEVEYGANYDPKSLISQISEGTLTNYTKSVDTSKVGKQKITFEVTKDNIVKKFSVLVNVKDTNVPTIALKSKEITIYKGDAYDLNSNIEKISDVIDGDIPFSDKDINSSYYTITSSLNSNELGDYTVYIKAYDSNKNVSEESFLIHVVERPVQITQAQTPAVNENINYTNSPSTVDTSSVLAAARSLLGTRYASGGTSPETGFDCSGFTSYIYGVIGKIISRSSSGQLNNGSPVNESNLQPGDIIIWANNGSNSASHSSVYAGDGTIIHATTNKGVQQTNINSWKAWGQHIIGIRRI